MLQATDVPDVLPPDVDDPRDGDEDLGDTLRYAITSYGADMLVDGVVRRLNGGDIFVPSFQRNYVWSQRQASRFLESLLLGLPVPGIFLFREPHSRKLMVVDGQQRLATLQRFYAGVFNGKKFVLTGVSEDLSGLGYNGLNASYRRELDDAIIHATIFEQLKPDDDRSSVYSVFERLNTGGSQLHPQEIRACVYRGRLNDLLSKLAGEESWKVLYRSKNSRKKDEEIILRFLALLYSMDSYERPMKQFLNDFMEKHMNLDDEQYKAFGDSFRMVTSTVAECLGPEALRPQRNLNVSVADAVMVGLARRLRRGPISDKEALLKAHKELMQRLEEEELYRSGTTNRDRVHRRIQIAVETYGGVA